MQLTCMEGEGIEILAENIENKNFIRKIFSQTEGIYTIYSRNVESSKRIGLILLRMFGNYGI